MECLSPYVLVAGIVIFYVIGLSIGLGAKNNKVHELEVKLKEMAARAEYFEGLSKQ
jgi:hypothetical protein